jgi:hypothetical protein
MLTGIREDARETTPDDRDRRYRGERPARLPDRDSMQVQAQLDHGPPRRQPVECAEAGNPDGEPSPEPAPGQIQFVDNLSDSLNSAAGDALYAQTLFLLLLVGP